MNLPVRTPARSLCAIAALLLILAWPAPGYGSNWIEPSGGSFQDAENWSAGVPGVGNNADFFLGTAGYTVTFAAGVTNQSLAVRNDIVTFDLGGFVYELTAAAYVGYDLFGSSASLTLQNGTLRQSGGTFGIGHGDGSDATVTLQFTTTVEGSELYVGSAASCDDTGPTTGLLNIENNSTVSAGSGSLAVCPDDTGTINVRNNATLEITPGSLFLGIQGDGFLTVDDSGTADLAGLKLGLVGIASGQVDVIGANARLTVSPGDTIIGDGGTGVVNVNSGGLFDASNSASFEVRRVGTMTVGAQGTLGTADTTVGSAGGGTATVNVTGGSAIWEIFGPASIGELGPGTVDIDLGGLLEHKDPEPWIVGQFGLVNVNAGGTLRTGGTVTPGGTTTIGSAAGGTADVNVSGAGALWEIFGPASIGELGPGTVDIASGGLVETTDPNPYIVGPDGVVGVNSGGTLITRGATRVGSAAGGQGELEVSGLGALWEIYEAVEVGVDGPGIVIVDNDGVAETKNPEPWIVGPEGSVFLFDGAILRTAGR